MNFGVEERAFTKRFQDTVVAQYPQIPVDYVGSRAVAKDGFLLRFRVKRASSLNSAVGGKVSRNYGSVLVQISTPANNGSAAFTEIADAVSGAFRNWRGNNGKIKCRSPGMMGPDDDGALITGTVDIPFLSEYSV